MVTEVFYDSVRSSWLLAELTLKPRQEWQLHCDRWMPLSSGLFFPKEPLEANFIDSGWVRDSSIQIFLKKNSWNHAVRLHTLQIRSSRSAYWVSLIRLFFFYPMTPLRFEEWSGETMPCDDSMRVLAGLLCVGEAWPKATVEALGDSVQASELSSSGKPGNGTKVPLMNFGVPEV